LVNLLQQILYYFAQLKATAIAVMPVINYKDSFTKVRLHQRQLIRQFTNLSYFLT